jgi:hypothetical protein
MWKMGKGKDISIDIISLCLQVGERDGMLLSMIGKYRIEVRWELIQKMSEEGRE